MAKLGRFKDDAARERYLRAYDALAQLWPMPVTEVDLPTRFGSSHVRSSGDGDRAPFLLLHGLGGAGPSWYESVAQLAHGRVVHAPDTIGSAGRSVQTAPLRSDADLAPWLAEVLDGLGAGRVHLVGESQGAWHAMLVALHLPERVASVALIEPNGVFAKTPLRALGAMLRHGARPSEEGWRQMAAWLTPGVELGPEMLQLARDAQGFRSSLGWARPLKDAEATRIRVPLLAIYGAESVLSNPPKAAARLAELVPQAEVEVYPGRGHGVLGEVRETVLSQVLDFARRHDDVAEPAAR